MAREYEAVVTFIVISFTFTDNGSLEMDASGSQGSLAAAKQIRTVPTKTMKQRAAVPTQG